MLRVPITFPPDQFYGAELSAMCVPDLLGTQGTFLLFTTRPAGERFKEGGLRVPVALDGDRIETADRADPRTCSSRVRRRCEMPLRITLDRARQAGARRSERARASTSSRAV